MFLIKRLWRQGCLLTLMMLTVGWARVFVGIHFAGDVTGGIGVGVVAAGLVAWVYFEGNPLDRFALRLL